MSGEYRYLQGHRLPVEPGAHQQDTLGAHHRFHNQHSCYCDRCLLWNECPTARRDRDWGLDILGETHHFHYYSYGVADTRGCYVLAFPPLALDLVPASYRYGCFSTFFSCCGCLRHLPDNG